MGLSIKRKFLLKDDALLDFLLKQNVILTPVKASYFFNNSLKFQEQNSTYTCENLQGCFEISKDGYKKARAKSKSIFYKRVYEFRINSNPCLIHILLGNFSKICLLEITFSDEIYGVFFKPPQFLAPFIEREVTTDNNYNEPRLELFGVSDEKFNFAEAIRVFKAFGISANYPVNLRIKDAVCVFLYHSVLKINSLKNDLFSSLDKEKILSLRDEIVSTKDMLELFSEIFDTRTAEFFISNFTKFEISISKLTRILDTLNLLDGFYKEQWLKNFLISAFDLESKNLSIFLENDSFLKDWEMFLSDTSDFFAGSRADEKTISFLAKCARSLVVKSCRHLKRLSQQSENTEFFIVFNELKQAKVLFFNFSGILLDDKIANRLDRLFTKLSSLKAFDDMLDLIQKIPRDEQTGELSAKIYTKIYKTRAKVLKSSKKFIQTTLKRSKRLKIYYKV